MAWRSFLIAFGIAYALNPLVERLTRWRVPRWLAVTFSLGSVALFGVAAGVTLLVVLDDLLTLPASLLRTFDSVPDWYARSAPGWLRDVVREVNATLAADPASQNSSDAELLSQVAALLTGFLEHTLTSAQGLLRSTVNAFVLFVFTGFTLASFPRIKKTLTEFFPVRSRPFVSDLSQKLDASVGGYLRAKLLEALIMGTVPWLYLALLGVPHAAALGFINALFNPIPYVGALVSTSVSALMALTVSWQLALVVLVTSVVVENLNGNVLGPLLLSKGVKVHPLVILIALIAGGSLFGFWGVLLAIPAAGFLQLLYLEYYQGSLWYQQEPSLREPRARSGGDM